MMDLISIIIPVYNVEKYIEECLDSVTAQTYTNIEVLLINDGSTDRSGQLCDRYAARDPRIKVFHQKNQGVASARNVGLQHVSKQSRYIGFVDSDDIISTSYYSDLYQAVSANNADLGITDFVRINANHDIIEKLCSDIIDFGVYSSQDIIKHSVAKEGWCYRMLWNKLYRRELFDGIQFPEHKLHEDENVAYLIFLKCKKIVGIKTEGYYYRVGNSESIMSNRMKKRTSDLLEAYIHNTKLLLDNDYTQAAQKMSLRAALEYRSLLKDEYEHSHELTSSYSSMLKSLKNKKAGLHNQIIGYILYTSLYLLPSVGYKLTKLGKKKNRK